MAEIHPNDIGLATFEDVGNVQKLKTAAKTVVDAINEVYETGGSTSKVIGEQLFVEGEGNFIFGENNAVYGNNNIVIGSNNAVVGDNMVVFNNNNIIENLHDFVADYFNVEDNSVTLNYNNPQYDYTNTPDLPFNVGDKVLVSCSVIWANKTFDDYITVNHDNMLATISEVNNAVHKIVLDGIPDLYIPPDDEHTIFEYSPMNSLAVFSESVKVDGTKTAINMGNTSSGTHSLAVNLGVAEGSSSFATNRATANGIASSSINSGNASGNNSFATNSSYSKSYNSTAINNATSGAPYSFAYGYYSRTTARPILCLKINADKHSITVANGQSTLGLVGRTLLLRYRYSATGTTINMVEAQITSVTSNEIFIDENTYIGTNSTPLYMPVDGLAFLLDTTASTAVPNSAGGGYCIASNKYSFANGYYTIAQHEGSVILGKNGMTDNNYSFAIGNGTSNGNLGLAFKVYQDGSVHADKEYTSPCADYAEFFEWKDGNPNAEDRVGYFVKIEDGKIVKCSDFDTPLGVISVTPAIIGDSGEMHWQGKYVTDDFGRIQYHEVVIPSEVDDDGNVITEEHTELQPMLNPNWDNAKPYIPRKDRPEWATVGVLGKLIVYDDGTLNVGDVCRCGDNGIAVKSVTNGYTVLKRVADDKVMIWFKG